MILPWNLILYALAGAGGGLLAQRTGIPSAGLVGALVGAALVSMSGRLELAQWPAGTQTFLQIAIGTVIGTGLTAEQVYVNQKITDLVSKAEMEQSDYRENRHLNVFFGPTKEYFGLKIGILWFNTSVLILSTLTLFAALGVILRKQIRMRVS